MKATHYRNLSISDLKENELRKEITEILPRIGSLDSLKLYYELQGGGLNETKGTWGSASEMIKESYELWRDKAIKRTIAVYPSVIQNESDSAISKSFVLEIEDADLTGTCRMFFKHPQPTETTGLRYTERN